MGSLGGGELRLLQVVRRRRYALRVALIRRAWLAHNLSHVEARSPLKARVHAGAQSLKLPRKVRVVDRIADAREALHGLHDRGIVRVHLARLEPAVDVAQGLAHDAET